MKRMISFVFSCVIAMCAIFLSSAIRADETKKTDAKTTAKVEVVDVDTSKLPDAFRKRYDALLIGDYGAIKASTGLMHALFTSYDEWEAWNRVILAGMPAKKDWTPPTYVTKQMERNEKVLCADLYGMGAVTCDARWQSYRNVTGPMLAWAYASQYPTHFTAMDAEAALKAVYKALGANLSYAEDVPMLKAWVSAKLDDKTKADAKSLYATFYTAVDYSSAAVVACRFDLSSAELQKALDGIAAAGESEEDAKWTTWKQDATAALKANETCRDIGWRYLGDDEECKDPQPSQSHWYDSPLTCLTKGPVTLDYPHDAKETKSLSLY